MPRVLPSDVVAAIDRMFPKVEPHSGFNLSDVPSLAALVQLVDAVPSELIRLGPQQNAEFTASAAAVRGFAEALQAMKPSAGTPMVLRNYPAHPIAMIRSALAQCPDEAASPATATLTFVADADLRDSIRLDVSEANRALVDGQWKAGTVLAGSALEALLLWALQQRETATPGVLAGAGTALVGNGTLTRPPDANLERWHLHESIAAALHLRLIEPATATQAGQAREFRNLIHPGRAQRLGQTCDRATVLAVLAAVEFVVRDLT